MDVGPGELLVIVVIVIVLFGAERVPRLARSLGEAIREFNRGAAGDRRSGRAVDDRRSGCRAGPLPGSAEEEPTDRHQVTDPDHDLFE